MIFAAKMDKFALQIPITILHVALKGKNSKASAHVVYFQIQIPLTSARYLALSALERLLPLHQLLQPDHLHMSPIHTFRSHTPSLRLAIALPALLPCSHALKIMMPA